MKKIHKGRALVVGLITAMAFSAPIVWAQTTGGDGEAQVEKRRGGREWSRGQRPGMHRGRGMAQGRMFRHLDLTDEQKAAMKQIRESHQTNARETRQLLMALNRELRQANRGETFDEGLAVQKLTEIAPLRAKLMAEQFRMRQEILALLTPEQKAKLEEGRQRSQTRRTEFRVRKSQRSQ